MGKVNITVNGRIFKLWCDDGEENRLRELAAYLDDHVQRLKASFGHVSDDQLFLMAGLMAADELWDLREAIKRGEGSRWPERGPEPTSPSQSGSPGNVTSPPGATTAPESSPPDFPGQTVKSSAPSQAFSSDLRQDERPTGVTPSQRDPQSISTGDETRMVGGAPAFPASAADAKAASEGTNVEIIPDRLTMRHETPSQNSSPSVGATKWVDGKK